jgi:NAD(P)-dependent dehydrogenase (short-subunit alcohol dehydrogenase family)
MGDRIAVVTGAAGGLGQAITGALQAGGHHVVGLDVNAGGLARMAGDGFTGMVVDLMDAGAIAGVFRQIGAEHGGIDVLVNNAGTCLMSDFPAIPAEEFEAQMRLNFGAAFHCCQAALPLMLPRPGIKRIVMVSSNGAYNFDVFDPPHYRASKAAMDNLMKDLARRYAKDGITANSIAPAMTETPLFGVLSDEVLARALAAMPRGHAMDAADVAAWVAFLCSPAGAISSGNVIILNQGRDVR